MYDDPGMILEEIVAAKHGEARAVYAAAVARGIEDPVVFVVDVTEPESHGAVLAEHFLPPEVYARHREAADRLRDEASRSGGGIPAALAIFPVPYDIAMPRLVKVLGDLPPWAETPAPEWTFRLFVTGPGADEDTVCGMYNARETLPADAQETQQYTRAARKGPVAPGPGRRDFIVRSCTRIL